MEGYASRTAVDVVAQYAQSSPENDTLAIGLEATRLGNARLCIIG